MKVLIVGAHPDDEVLGAGGALSRHVAQGDDVFVCIATKAFEPRWSASYIAEKVAEQKKFDAFMGIRGRYNLDLPTTTLNTVPHGEINQKVTDVVGRVEPDVIYTHGDCDLNVDHGIVFSACLVAARPPRRVRLCCFETLSETEWGGGSFKPNLWVDIGPYLEKKIEAFRIYKSEVKPFPHPRSPEGIRALAAKRGSEACVQYAEAFAIAREFWGDR